MMNGKLGLLEKKDGDKKIISDLLNWMENNKADYTNTFLYLLEDNFRNNKIYEKKHLSNGTKIGKIVSVMNRC